MLVGLLGGLAAVFAVWATGSIRNSDLWRFIGRFHPTLVHLPIGILLVAIGLEVAGRVLRQTRFREAASTLLVVGAWTAVATAITGLLLANWGGYPAAVLTWHRLLGLGVTILAVTVVGLRIRSEKSPNDGTRRLYPAALGLLGIGLVVGGHLGGTLTHGEGYLTDALPLPVRPLLGLAPKTGLGTLPVGNLDSASAFQALVQPILTQRCGSCHNPDQKKGGLSLASLDDLLAGGKDGKVMVPGRSGESEITKRLWLPPGHPDRMPPDRTIPIAEAELIRWWIDQGAPAHLKLAEIDRPPALRKVLESYGLDDLPTGIFTLRVPLADSAAVGAARRSGLRVEPVAANSPFLDVAANGSLAPAALDAITGLAPQIAWIDLRGTDADDATVRRLGTMAHLARINLEHTRVTDAGLAALKDLQFLEYLNLYGTGVTDEGLKQLVELKRLRSLFLWGTKVTAAGADSLRRALPRLLIDLGTVPLLDTAAIR